MQATRQFEVNTQSARALVNVTVSRNEFEPRFTMGEFRVDNLSEKTPVGTSILTVTAEDRDNVSFPSTGHYSEPQT